MCAHVCVRVCLCVGVYDGKVFVCVRLSVSEFVYVSVFASVCVCVYISVCLRMCM